MKLTDKKGSTVTYPDLGVVIVTYNHHDLLRSCLRSVQLAMVGIPGEIYIVDNASMDETRPMLREEFPSVRVIYNDVNVHYTRAVNQGMRAAKEKYVFLLNDDTVLEPECLQELLKLAEARPRIGAIGPMSSLASTGEFDVSVQRFPTPYREFMRLTGVAAYRSRHGTAGSEQMHYDLPLDTRQVDWVGGGFILLPRKLMHELGYHDENYLFYRDDPDIGLRLKSADREVWFCTEAKLVHHHGMSTVKTASKVRFKIIAIRSRRHFYLKHYGLLGCLVVEATSVGMSILRTIKSLILLRFSAAGEGVSQITNFARSLAMPDEEREAVEGYAKARFNGATDETGSPPRACEVGTSDSVRT